MAQPTNLGSAPPESKPPVRLRAGSATHAGRVRSQNQDRLLVVDNALFLVADGMGGHVGGEVAAQVTVDTLRTLGSNNDALLQPNQVTDRIEAANVEILTRADDEPDLRGMGTTLTGVVVVEGDATSPALLLVVNVGDSRTYWMRGGDLEQLSEDHSVVGELIRDGKLSASEARTHKSRSVLTRALGVEPGVECDVLEVVPIVGDRFLICSDGLPTELADATIAATLRKLADPTEAAEALVRDAVDHGGRDNVTVIVVDVIAGVDGNGALHEATSPAPARPTTTPSTTDTPSAGSSTPKQPRQPRGKRRPWIINLRVLIFLAALAALGVVVVWTLRNAPASDESPTTNTVAVSTTESGATTDAGPTAPPTTPTKSSLPASAVDTIPVIDDTKIAGTGTGTVTGTANSNSSAATSDAVVADPVPGAVVDPFATTTTTITPTTTTRKRRR